MDTGFNKV